MQYSLAVNKYAAAAAAAASPPHSWWPPHLCPAPPAPIVPHPAPLARRGRLPVSSLPPSSSGPSSAGPSSSSGGGEEARPPGGAVKAELPDADAEWGYDDYGQVEQLFAASGEHFF